MAMEGYTNNKNLMLKKNKGRLLVIASLVVLIYAGFRKNLHLGDANATSSPSTRNKPTPTPTPNVKKGNTTFRMLPHFVPFPHKCLAIGEDAQCDWVARNSSDYHDSLVSSLLGPSLDHGLQGPDAIQTVALKETVCIPRNKKDDSKLHLYSTAEANACLASNDVTVLIAGDSYNKQLFIGLVDILANRAGTYQFFNSKVRNRAIESSTKLMEELNANTDTDVNATTVPRVVWECNPDCRGEVKPFWSRCSNCIQQFRNSHPGKTVIPVVGLAVHIYRQYGGNVTRVLEEFDNFLHATDNVIFNSQPSYHLDYVPLKYKNETLGREGTYYGMLPKLPNYYNNGHQKMRYLDFFQLTDSCRWKNCSLDGGHGSRFVNRWKAQLLLNTVCSF